MPKPTASSAGTGLVCQGSCCSENLLSSSLEVQPTIATYFAFPNPTFPNMIPSDPPDIISAIPTYCGQINAPASEWTN